MVWETEELHGLSVLYAKTSLCAQHYGNASLLNKIRPRWTRSEAVHLFHLRLPVFLRTSFLMLPNFFFFLFLPFKKITITNTKVAESKSVLGCLVVAQYIVDMKQSSTNLLSSNLNNWRESRLYTAKITSYAYQSLLIGSMRLSEVSSKQRDISTWMCGKLHFFNNTFQMNKAALH